MKRKKYVIIMGAGSGTRMGGDLPKQFMELDGKAILQRTMEVFIGTCPDITIITVLPEMFMEYWRAYCVEHNFIHPQLLVKGGITRFHSVRNALERVPDGALVAIHDGVRPLLSCDLVSDMFEKAEDVMGLIPVVPCVDTMKVLEKTTTPEGHEQLIPVSGMTADRTLLYCVQTPQIFYSEEIKAAYSQPYDVAFTDDASVFEKYGKSLSYTMGERLNIKITTREDLIFAEAVMSVR